ncbi:11887_t:CDS:2 [Acaulospora colombiana]|uniref:11887_t:CDS:1 n=1 Tax=Acaulospora colombiana TaxID=27376 RepID=A0ACA9KWB2_9GLOM|nr:11887_t:CDS:2 [Acaulospora colombiana]
MYIGQSLCERANVLRMLITEQKLPYTNFSKISRCTDYVNHGTGNPVAIIKYLIEKKWFSENTRCDEYGDDDRTEDVRRSLALDVWIREKIDNGVITSPKYDPVEGRVPKSLWVTVKRKIEELLLQVPLQASDETMYLKFTEVWWEGRVKNGPSPTAKNSV